MHQPTFRGYFYVSDVKPRFIDHALLTAFSLTGRGDLPVPGRLQELAHQERQAQLDHHR